MKAIKIKATSPEQFLQIQETLFSKGFHYVKTGQQLKEYDPDIIGIHAFWNSEEVEKYTRLITLTKCPRIWGYYPQSGFLRNDELALAAVKELGLKKVRA